MVQPFFCKNPEMYGWLKEFVNRREEQAGYEPISQGHLKQERPEEQTLEIGEECENAKIKLINCTPSCLV